MPRSVIEYEPPPNRGESAARFIHTPSFPGILGQLGISLAITTYQAGKVLFLRAEGGVIKTHSRALNRPMGLAVGQGRLAIGTSSEVRDFQALQDATSPLETSAAHHTCYTPRAVHVTGDIQIHEMAYVDETLVFVNTRYSCLATHDPENRFVPTWRPSFVSQLTPDDRCHLNGLAVVDGRPKWVTALGATDTAGGWRDNKEHGGVLIDVDSSEITASGLSMPHSPRWHNGRLWLLESGTGTLGFVDAATGHYEPVIRLDGFTRGLDFAGDFAFVGLSQVRQSATFSGIEITERLQATNRTCGICVIDLVRGEPIAILKFADAVQEIFAVCVLPGTQYRDLVTRRAKDPRASDGVPQDTLESFPLKCDCQFPDSTISRPMRH